MHLKCCKCICDIANTCNITNALLKFWPILITFDYNREKDETFPVWMMICAITNRNIWLKTLFFCF